jgi:transcriptional repressor NrdR
MKCPFCLHGETRVIDKRDGEGFTKRRRECVKCKRRFNTHENVDKIEVKVVKKDGRREIFDEEKMRRGIVRACEKRPVSTEQIDSLVKNIEDKIRKKSVKEVQSAVIGEIVSKELKKLDNVAYIRFASVYKEFRDISDFRKEIKEMGKR